MYTQRPALYVHTPGARRIYITIERENVRGPRGLLAGRIIIL